MEGDATWWNHPGGMNSSSPGFCSNSIDSACSKNGCFAESRSNASTMLLNDAKRNDKYNKDEHRSICGNFMLRIKNSCIYYDEMELTVHHWEIGPPAP